MDDGENKGAELKVFRVFICSDGREWKERLICIYLHKATMGSISFCSNNVQYSELKGMPFAVIYQAAIS